VEPHGTITFRKPFRWKVVFFVGEFLLAFCSYICPIAAVRFFSPRTPLFFWQGLVFALGLAMALEFRESLNTVEICSDGVRSFGFWIPWSDVFGVEYRRTYGIFPYLEVKQSSGPSRWIPLYFEGASDFWQTLIAAAPVGSPFRSVSIPA